MQVIFNRAGCFSTRPTPFHCTALQKLQFNTLANPSLAFADGWDRFDGGLPLSSCLINLAVECLSWRDTWLTQAPAPMAVKMLCGQWLEGLIADQIRQWANPDLLSVKIRLLRQKLQQTDEGASGRHPAATPSARDVATLSLQVVRLLETRLPSKQFKYIQTALLVQFAKVIAY